MEASPHADAERDPAERFRAEAWPVLPALLRVAQLLCRDDDRAEEVLPRTILFAGKAAPGYAAATRVIKLINTILSTR